MLFMIACRFTYASRSPPWFFQPTCPGSEACVFFSSAPTAEWLRIPPNVSDVVAPVAKALFLTT
jgi:hypothetical protein